MDIIELIGNSPSTLKYISENPDQILKYRTEFFLKDLKKIFAKLGVNRYKVKIKVNGQELKEEGNTDKLIDFLKVNSTDESIEIEIVVNNRKQRFVIEQNGDNIFTHDKGYQILQQLFKRTRLKSKFHKLFEEALNSEMVRFAEIIFLIKEGATNEATTKTRKPKSEEQLINKSLKLQRKAIREAFVAINVASVIFDDLFSRDNLDYIPDGYTGGYDEITKDTDSVIEYIFWFILQSFKEVCISEDRFFITLIAAKSALNSALSVFISVVENI